MKQFKLFLFGMVLTAGLGTYVWAEGLPAEKPSAEIIAKGKELFNAKEGLKVKFACILCHKGEKAVSASAVQKAGDKLPTVINKYITQKSKGKAIAADSAEMQALMAYIRYEHSK
jgi:cytochrome c